MEKIVHWTSLRPSFSLDDSEGTSWWARQKISYGKCLLVDTGGLATCADKRSSEGGRIIWPTGNGAKTAWLFPHAEGDLPAALDLAANLRSTDGIKGWPKTGCGRNSKSRTYRIR